MKGATANQSKADGIAVEQATGGVIPQYLVAIHHPDDYDPSVEDEAMARDIDVLDEMVVAGAQGGHRLSGTRRGAPVSLTENAKSARFNATRPKPSFPRNSARKVELVSCRPDDRNDPLLSKGCFHWCPR